MKAKSLIKRVKSYFKDKLDSPKTTILMEHFNSLEYIITNSENEALILEATLIKKTDNRKAQFSFIKTSYNYKQ